VRFWYISASGRFQRLQQECGPRGAAQQTDYRFPPGTGAGALQPDFVYGPKDDCTSGDTVNLMVTVDGVSPGGIAPQFWGPAQTTLNMPTGTRAIVQVSDATQWPRSPGDTIQPQRIEDVRPGMLLQATGTYDANCVIQAGMMLSSIPPVPAATPGTLSHYDISYWGIGLDYPSTWVADPNYGSIGGISNSYADPSGRENGFFLVDILSAPSLDYAVDGWAHHKLRPFGDNPIVVDLNIPAGVAKLILPDPADPSVHEASIMMPLPVPVGGTFSYLQLDATAANIMGIAQSLVLTAAPPVPPSPPSQPFGPGTSPVASPPATP
jgi:hypothetical protein